MTQLDQAQAELARDRAALAVIEAEAAHAAARWNDAAQRAQRYERWLRRKSVAAVETGA
jgi:hypothetical protein